MPEKIELTISEKIDRARDGRSQSSIVTKMNAMGITISDVQFSRKKNGFGSFTEEELVILSEILSTDLTD